MKKKKVSRSSISDDYVLTRFKLTKTNDLRCDSWRVVFTGRSRLGECTECVSPGSSTSILTTADSSTHDPFVIYSLCIFLSSNSIIKPRTEKEEQNLREIKK